MKNHVNVKITGNGGAIWANVQHLASSDKIRGGQICVKGTRIPIYILLESIDEDELSQTMGLEPAEKQALIKARDELVRIFAQRPKELGEIS
jgi:hypothetical protein